jgi:hypothetical protein
MFAVLVSVLLSLNVTIAPSQGMASSNPRERAETAVVEAARLLEAKDYKAFLSQFMPPDQLKARAATPEALDAFAEQFAPRADRLLEALKHVRAQTPAYDSENTSATFTLDGLSGMPSTSLTFTKIGQYWYLANR